MTQPIAPYLNVRQAYGASFTGDGEHVAFLTTITGVPQVWQVAVGAAEPAWPDQLTFDTERVSLVVCSPVAGEARLIYARDQGGNENAQFFLLDPTTGVEQPLTAGYADALHSWGDWSADGRHIAFAANRRDPAIFDVYVQPLDGSARLVWQHDRPGFLVKQAFSPDQRHLVVTRVSDSRRTDLFEIELASGTVRHLTPDADPARYEAMVYAPDGGSLVVQTDRDSDFTYLARLDLATLALTPLLQLSWDIEFLSGSHDGTQLAYVVNEDGVSRLWIYDLATATQRRAPIDMTVPGVIGFLDEQLTWSVDDRQLLFSLTTATRTSDVFVWDLIDDTVRPLTRSAHGGLPVANFVAPTLIHYPTFDERSIPAWWYRPAQAAEPLPVVVVVHGGPEAQFRPYYHFFVQYFVNNGYAVLAPNVRGSTGYGKTYAHLDDRRLRMDSVADLAHAALWLKVQPGIDGERLAVYGGSYGGFMVLATLTTNPELWAAGIDVVGISNFVTFLQNTSAYRRAHRESEYGSLAEDRDFLEATAPINHLDRVTAPLMVIHGANDPRVPLSEAQQLVNSLAARDVPVEFLVFDDEGHGLIKLKNKLVAYPQMVAFLDQQLRR